MYIPYVQALQRNVLLHRHLQPLHNANYDNHFNDAAKIWLEGSGETVGPVDPELLVRFENPLNGRVYVTMKAPEGPGYGVGALMLNQANRAVDVWTAAKDDPELDTDTVDYYRWRIENFTENIEVIRGLYDLYGYIYF